MLKSITLRFTELSEVTPIPTDGVTIFVGPNNSGKSRALLQIRLDGRTRFELTSDRPTGDLLGRPQNILAHLFQDDSLRKDVREIIHDAFGVYFVIDPLAGGNLRIRLSEDPPTHDEQSLGHA